MSLAGDGPLFVLLHGTLVSNGVMGPIARLLLADGFEVAGPDLRGHGHSTNGAEGLSIDRYARDLISVLGALPQKPVVIVGHSAGGMAALAFAERYAAAVDIVGLILISTSSVGIAGWKERLAAPILFNGLLDWMLERPRLGRGFARTLFAQDPGRDTLEAVRRIMAGSSRSAKRSAPRVVFDFNLSPDLDRVLLPALVVHGQLDTSVHPSFAEQLSSDLPDARSIVFPDAGHMVVLEEAVALARAIGEFARTI